MSPRFDVRETQARDSERQRVHHSNRLSPAIAGSRSYLAFTLGSRPRLYAFARYRGLKILNAIEARLPLFRAIIFTVLDLRFTPRCALEASNAGNVRFDKIQNIIAECKYSIHDISRTQLDKAHRLPRFNMPLEFANAFSVLGVY